MPTASICYLCVCSLLDTWRRTRYACLWNVIRPGKTPSRQSASRASHAPPSVTIAAGCRRPSALPPTCSNPKHQHTPLASLLQRAPPPVALTSDVAASRRARRRHSHRRPPPCQKLHPRQEYPISHLPQIPPGRRLHR